MDIKARRAALFSRTSTETLLDSMDVLHTVIDLDPADQHNRMVYAWTVDEVTKRIDGADAALDLLYADLECDTPTHLILRALHNKAA